MQRPEETSNGQSNANKRDRVQLVANVVTILTGLVGIAGLVSGQTLWVLPVVAATIFMGYSLKHRHFKSAVLGLVVVALVAVAGAYSYSRHDNTTPATAQPSSTSTAPTANSATPSDASSADDTPKVLVDDNNITLNRSQAIDVDQPGQTPQDSDGPAGPLDVYFSATSMPGSVLFHAGQVVYNPSRASDHYAACANQLDPNGSNRNSQPLGLSAYIGSDTCFRTSEGHMGWAGVASVKQPIKSESATAVTLHVIVWDKVVNP